MASDETLALLRSRLCNPSFVFAALKAFPNSNYGKLKCLVSDSISEACNNSVLLLGPRGSGKNAVVDLVLGDLKVEHPDMISVVSLNGLLHSDDNCALKEIARQLCLEHQLLFSRMASSDDNTLFMLDMLRECGLAHKTVIFVMDEFDLFTQGKQRLLYSLLDALQTLNSQAVVIGISCRVDADQLLEKRVRSRFSHRKLLFVPPSTEETVSLIEHLLYLPKDGTFSSNYVKEFNSNIQSILDDKKFIGILSSLVNLDGTVGNLLRFLFRVVNGIDMESGLLGLESFKNALSHSERQPMLDKLQDVSILELYMLVCMSRLQSKNQNSYNFTSIMKEYKSIREAFKTVDSYGHNVCLRAFEHLLQRELAGFIDPRTRNQSMEFRPVRLLIYPRELHKGLKLNSSCPSILQNLLDHESFR